MQGQVPAKSKNNLPDSEPFDIDTPVETIQAYAANYRSNPKRAGTDNRVRMPKERWLSLDDKTKAIWDSIDNKFKNIILGYTVSSPSFSLVAVNPFLSQQLSPLLVHIKHF
jgi:hypothetical protein